MRKLESIVYWPWREQYVASKLSVDRLRSIVVTAVTHLPDYRKQPNRTYELSDVALGVFAVFFMQSASFLAYQRDMQRTKGRNNAQSLCRRSAASEIPIEVGPKSLSE
jgi:hypothetical protein